MRPTKLLVRKDSMRGGEEDEMEERKTWKSKIDNVEIDIPFRAAIMSKIV